MFSDTLAENMRLVKPDATDEEIIDALKIACAYDFVLKERKGIYCSVGDGGVGFSEGEYSDDEGTHVGIENTRKRLDMMINARLEIESKKGEGTTASVYIPKRSD